MARDGLKGFMRDHMVTRRKCLVFERSSGNVFADLGFEHPEQELAQADALLARMQHPESGANMRAAFEATPEQLGQAAVAAAKGSPMPWRVVEVRPLPDCQIRVRFVDGLEGTVDLSVLIRSPTAGVFAPLADPAVFARVAVVCGAVTWPGGIDLAPDAMHAEIAQRGNWILTESREFPGVLRLSARDSELFVDTLEHPPEPNARLLEAARSYGASQRQGLRTTETAGTLSLPPDQLSAVLAEDAQEDEAAFIDGVLRGLEDVKEGRVMSLAQIRARCGRRRPRATLPPWRAALQRCRRGALRRSADTPARYRLNALLRAGTPENRHPLIEPSGPVDQEVW